MKVKIRGTTLGGTMVAPNVSTAIQPLFGQKAAGVSGRERNRALRLLKGLLALGRLGSYINSHGSYPRGRCPKGFSADRKRAATGLTQMARGANRTKV